MIGAYGDLIFNISSDQFYTFDEFSLSTQLETETQEVIGSKPSTYIKGLGLDSLSLKIILDASLGVDVRSEIVMWQNTCGSGKPHAFSIGGSPVSQYPWLLKNVDVSGVRIGPDGKITRAELSIKLEEYVRAGSAVSSSTGIYETAALSREVDESIAASLFNPDTSAIRDNPNMIAAISSGAYLDTDT